jgi:hypothetical protein
MAEWNRNELLLLERGDPEALGMIGQRRSEALAVMRETMRSYTRGNLLGRGYLQGRITGEIRPTAPREHAVSALLASQWGLPGTAGLVLLLAGLLVPAARALEPTRADGSRRGGWVLAAALSVPTLLAVLLPAPWGLLALVVASGAALAWLVAPSRGGAPEPAPPGGTPALGLGPAIGALSLFVMAGAGLYMVLANYGLVLFTGKNVYLLGIDSVGDVVEGVALLALAAAALSLRPTSNTVHGESSTPARLRPAEIRGVIESPSVEEVGV